MTAGWSPDCACPECGRAPNVGFSPDQVERAKRERQAARIMSVRCLRCGKHYWIRAQDIARAKPPGFFLLLDAKTAAALRKAGLTNAGDIEARIRSGTLGDVDGIGEVRQREIRKALDASAMACVA